MPSVGQTSQNVADPFMPRFGARIPPGMGRAQWRTRPDESSFHVKQAWSIFSAPVSAGARYAHAGRSDYRERCEHWSRLQNRHRAGVALVHVKRARSACIAHRANTTLSAEPPATAAQGSWPSCPERSREAGHRRISAGRMPSSTARTSDFTTFLAGSSVNRTCPTVSEVGRRFDSPT